MTDFFMRYLGILVSGFCIGYAHQYRFETFFMSIVTALAVLTSCLYYYNKGQKDEPL